MLPRRAREDTPARRAAPEAPPGAARRRSRATSRERPGTARRRAGARRLGERARRDARAARECSPSVAPGRVHAPTSSSARRSTGTGARTRSCPRGSRATEAPRPSSTPRTTRCCCAPGSCASAPLPDASGEPLRYRHVAIDEVQDFSPLEVQVLLGCLDERRSITLAGDTQQHVLEDAGFTSWADVLRAARPRGRRGQHAEVSYRCSQRDRGVRAPACSASCARTTTPPRTHASGPPVELFRFTDHGACVAFLADALQELAAQRAARVGRGADAVAASSARSTTRGLDNSEVPRLRRVDAPGLHASRPASRSPRSSR